MRNRKVSCDVVRGVDVACHALNEVELRDGWSFVGASPLDSVCRDDERCGVGGVRKYGLCRESCGQGWLTLFFLRRSRRRGGVAGC